MTQNFFFVNVSPEHNGCLGGTEHSFYSSCRALMLCKIWPLKTANMSTIQDASGFAVICFVQKMQHLFIDVSFDSWRLHEPISFIKIFSPGLNNAEVASRSKDVCLVHLYWQAWSQSLDMTVQPPVRKDLLLPSYQWGRGVLHAQMKTWKCSKNRAEPKVMQRTACYTAFELERAEHTQTRK